MLAVEKVRVSYGSNGNRINALDDLSLNFEKGKLTLVMGPSGSGKTTMLCLLGCLLSPDDGSVFVNGENVAKLSPAERTGLRRHQIGFIFQAFRLFHSLSAFDNVMVTAEIDGDRSEERCSAARQLLETLGLGDKLHLKPKELSGGEKQRVAIARALLANPKILLADEPTASLDSSAGRQICEILRGLAEEKQHTVVVVSHDPRWTHFAHRTVVLEDGRLVDQGGITK